MAKNINREYGNMRVRRQPAKPLHTSRIKTALTQLRSEWEALNEEEMLVMSENVYKRILDISRIVACPLSYNDKQRQIFQLVHYIACDLDVCKRVKDMASSSIEKAQAIMDHLQYVSRDKLIFDP
jgi:hypothetical protein